MKTKKIKNCDVMPVDDFWYDLIEGGYLDPKKYLSNQVDIDAVNNAISTLNDYRKSLIKGGCIEEM